MTNLKELNGDERIRIWDKLHKFLIKKNFKQDLELFVEDYLAYILDDSDFWFEVIKMKNENIYEIFLGHKLYFEWEKIEDYFIPFLVVLNQQYKLFDKEIEFECAHDTVVLTNHQVLFENPSELLMGSDSKYNRTMLTGINLKIKSPE